MSEDSSFKRHNKKRKKSFLKNARKYARKGYYGRGSQLDADTYQYFVRIMEAYREGFDSDEDKMAFVNNVFEQTENQEINCSSNQVGCRVIETLLPFANDVVFKRFIEAFCSELRPLSSDRFASHVLESLVKHSCKKSSDDVNIGEEVKMYYKGFVIKISKFLLNNLEDYIWNTYGNHVIRTCLQSLSHIPEDETKQSENMENIIPIEYSEIVIDYANRLIAWPQFTELCYSELTSGFLQVLLKCLKKVDPKLLKMYCKKLLKDVFSLNTEEIPNETFPKPFLSKSVIMLLETLICICSEKIYLKVYESLFKGRLVKLSTTRSTNFSVQKLLQHCNNKIIFESMFDELSAHFGNILEVGHSGVILAIAQSCRHLCSKQGTYVQNLMKTLHCFEPESRHNYFVLCLCHLQRFEENEKMPRENLQKEKLNLHGTLILQLLLDFNKPIKIINSLLSIDTFDLKNLFSNTMGSHIVDSYMKGSFVGEKSREKLVKKMLGTYRDLATTKYGSRSFEAIWNAANFKMRIQIMEELSIKEGAWTNSDFGKIIAVKVNLLMFKRNKEDWKNVLYNTNKSEKFLEDILSK